MTTIPIIAIFAVLTAAAWAAHRGLCWIRRAGAGKPGGDRVPR